jgi:hypothetical protein
MVAYQEKATTRVVYYLQTHSRPAQIARLVQVITEGSPDGVILIGHDAAARPLDVRALEALGNVHVLSQPGGYGDFSHVDRYLAAVDWLDERGISYDWLENLTGQCYPVRPVAEIEATLAATDGDGFLLYSPVFPERVPDDVDQGAAPGYRLCRPFDARMRYDFKFWRLGAPTPAKRRLMRPFMLLDLIQPWFQVSNSFAALGIRNRRPPFGPGFYLYGGSFFCTLRADAARYARDYAKANPDIVSCFRRSLGPDEVFLQTVLVNSGKFSFVPDSRRYIDWTGCTHLSPRTLGLEDVDKMLASDAHWARKLDLSAGAEVFDRLDQRVRAGLPTP